jgi:hypothetical protein
MEDQAFETQLPGKAANTATADGDRAGAEFSSYTYPLPSGGAAAIATCTSLDNACCSHGLEDAEMVQGQDELRIMVQIGCRCPLDKRQAGFIPRARTRFQGPRGAGRLARAARGSEGGRLSWRQQRLRP